MALRLSAECSLKVSAFGLKITGDSGSLNRKFKAETFPRRTLQGIIKMIESWAA
jgi:hypothetical protein